MANPHLQVIEAAVATDKALGRLFASSIGSKSKPKGEMVGAYRAAREKLAGNVNKPAAGTILNEYRSQISNAARDGARQAAEIARQQAQRTGEVLNIRLGTVMNMERLINETATRVLVVVDGQVRAIQSGTLTEAQVLGDEVSGRVGLFAPGAVQKEASSAYADLAALLFGQLVFVSPDVRGGGGASPYLRQAVAAIDNLTTPCCLGVHGQVVGLDDPFYTPDPPAFARYQDRPPFHAHCRTATTLVLREMAEDDLTADMVKAAKLEEKLRGTKGYELPKYVNAFTRIRR